ncbi:BON domain-containing protein [Thermohalobacter berrensis]|uniref:BON domain-containing protein n=1 Tax=Thermohalobacter berrensis TaxID=99594 RepID=A0A419T5Q0_9FIRM|nr:BON domain-containing protein [Thermohalobacter berrensis]RKD32765.1 hypothetical protein BET03_10560 [Thermohalobacter berrensis]
MNKKEKKEHLSKDELIVDLIKDQLEEKMQASSMDINVTCRSGVVNLSGFVDVLKEKKFAENIARKINGVKKVENNLTIGVDSQITDKHIEKEVINKLNNNKINDKTHGIGVKVNDGVVNLVGHVDKVKDAHIAMDLASQVRGVKDVVNNTENINKGIIDDVSINNAIRERLNDANFSGEDIVCDVVDGKVTLSGYTKSKREIELAKEIAMDIEGVNKVRNKIQIRKRNK